MEGLSCRQQSAGDVEASFGIVKRFCEQKAPEVMELIEDSVESLRRCKRLSSLASMMKNCPILSK